MSAAIIVVLTLLALLRLVVFPFKKPEEF